MTTTDPSRTTPAAPTGGEAFRNSVRDLCTLTLGSATDAVQDQKDGVARAILQALAAPAAPAAGGVAGVPTVDEFSSRLKRIHRQIVLDYGGVTFNDWHYDEMARYTLTGLPPGPDRDAAIARLADPRAGADAWVPGGDWTPNATTIAAMEDARAGRTTPITLDELRAGILADPDAPTFSPRLEAAWRAYGEAQAAAHEPNSDDEGALSGLERLDAAAEAGWTFRRAIRAEIDAAPGRVDAVALREAALTVLNRWEGHGGVIFRGAMNDLRAALATAGGDGSAGDGWRACGACFTPDACRSWRHCKAAPPAAQPETAK